MILSGLVTLGLAGCSRHVADEAPPRATDTIAVPAQTSVIAVPVQADLGALAAALDRAVPKRLWSIDKPGQTCVAPKKVKILFAKITTPTITCRIVGQVTRGAMTFGGSGRDIVVTMPIHAVVSARDIGHLVSNETATADARVRAVVRFDMGRDWSPHGTVDIRYDWTDPPHVDILGQRIAFADRADAKLRQVVGKLEATLPAELDKLKLRRRISEAWHGAFTSLRLNASDPSVWMRITPRSLAYGGYRIDGRTLKLSLGLTATTETFVGPRPADPDPVALPAMVPMDQPPGRVLFAIPVIAAYRELEPVIAKALAKRAQRPFDVPGIGPVSARFGHVTVYGSTGGRIAVGLDFAASTGGAERARGTVWLTALPRNAPNSRRVDFTDIRLGGITNSTGTDLLIRLANAPGLSRTIAGSLGQNFEKDFDSLLAKVDRAIDQKRIGDLVIRAHLTKINTGKMRATGQGVYLPVTGTGTASISLAAE